MKLVLDHDSLQVVIESDSVEEIRFAAAVPGSSHPYEDVISSISRGMSIHGGIVLAHALHEANMVGD